MEFNCVLRCLLCSGSEMEPNPRSQMLRGKLSSINSPSLLAGAVRPSKEWMNCWVVFFSLLANEIGLIVRCARPLCCSPFIHQSSSLRCLSFPFIGFTERRKQRAAQGEEIDWMKWSCTPTLVFQLSKLH